MRPWILAGLGVFIVLFAAGVLITELPKRRAAAEQAACKNNLKNLASFAAMNSDPDPAKAARSPHEIPAGTIHLVGSKPEDRLSWVVAALPMTDQRHQKATELLEAIDRAQPWAHPKNQLAGKRKLIAVLCPGNPPELEADRPAPTQFVGIAGLGTNAAELNFVPPSPAPPRAGAFRYDSPTPFSSVSDGLSQTLLFGEHANEIGPWLRGGPDTLRGLDDSPNAKAFIGPGGQFGGNHPETSNWAMADGSVQSFTPRIDPKILASLFTIAGKDVDAVPGE